MAKARAQSEIVERLAELRDSEYGWALLRLLKLAGWQIAITSRFGGGVIVTVTKPGVGRVVEQGEGSGELAPRLFTAAVELQRCKDRREEDAARRLLRLRALP